MSIGVSLGRAFSFPGNQLCGFIVQGGNEFAVVRKSLGHASGPDVGVSFGQAGVDDPALCGVYSSSAVGNLERSINSLGVMTILPRWNSKFTRSPLERPAWRRTAVGIVT